MTTEQVILEIVGISFMLAGFGILTVILTPIAKKYLEFKNRIK